MVKFSRSNGVPMNYRHFYWKNFSGDGLSYHIKSDLSLRKKKRSYASKAEND